MRILLVAALVCFILALLCLIIPTTIANANWPTWLMAGLIAWVLDALTGGYVFTANRG